MATVLQMDQLRRAFAYDPETGEIRWVVPPKAHPRLRGMLAGSPMPGRGGKTYHAIQFGGRKIKRSRLAFALMEGRWPEQCVDHINGDSLDDRWCNLREATVTQNAWNHRSRAKRLALPMGVRTNPSGRYSARIQVNKRAIQVGTFNTIAEAEAAYRAAREVYFGNYS